MLYDAILNGARSIAFYGGNNPNCWTATRQPVRLELELLELGAEAASGRDQLAEPAGAGARESGHDPDVAGERCDDPGDQPARQFRRSLGDCGPPRRGHGTRDDRRASRSGVHGHRLHRGTVDHRLQRLVHRRLLAVGRARLPLRSRRTPPPPPQRRHRRPPAEAASALTSSPSWAGPAGSVKVGDRLDLTLTVANKGGLAQGVVATVSPSANVTISGSAADRGPGCVAGPPFVCDLDFLGPPGTVRLCGHGDRAGAGGDHCLRTSPPDGHEPRGQRRDVEDRAGGGALALTPVERCEGCTKTVRTRHRQAGHTPRHERAGQPVRARRPRRPLRLRRP